MFSRLGAFLLILGLILAVLTMSCGLVAESTELYSKDFTLGADALVTVRNTEGNISIVTWGKEYVEVNAEKKTTWGMSELDKVDIVVTTNPDNLLIETKVLQKNARVTVNYDIKLPRNVIMSNIDVQNGDVYLEGTNGSTIITASLGGVRVKNTSGYLTVTAEAGKIELEGTTGGAKLVTSNRGIFINKADGDISATTSNGKIEVKDCKGYVTLDTSRSGILVDGLEGFVVLARTSYGPIHIRNVEGVEAVENDNGSIEVELASIRDDGASITTTRGSISVYLSPDLNANIELKTPSGEWSWSTGTAGIELEAPTHMKGTLGDGGSLIYVEAIRGDIYVYALEVA